MHVLCGRGADAPAIAHKHVPRPRPAVRHLEIRGNAISSDIRPHSKRADRRSPQVANVANRSGAYLRLPMGMKRVHRMKPAVENVLGDGLHAWCCGRCCRRWARVSGRARWLRPRVARRQHEAGDEQRRFYVHESCPIWRRTSAYHGAAAFTAPPVGCPLLHSRVLARFGHALGPSTPPAAPRLP
jgi:hypothetical protein